MYCATLHPAYTSSPAHRFPDRYANKYYVYQYVLYMSSNKWSDYILLSIMHLRQPLLCWSSCSFRPATVRRASAFLQFRSKFSECRTLMTLGQGLLPSPRARRHSPLKKQNKNNHHHHKGMVIIWEMNYINVCRKYVA